MINGSEAIQQLINALSVGSTYALLALGLAMVFAVLRMVNFAHGELVTIAGYSMYFVHRSGLPFVFQIVAALLAAALAAYLMERVAFRPLRSASFSTLLFSSFAVSVIIQNVISIVVSPRPKGVPFPAFFNETLHAGTFFISWTQIGAAGSCLLSLFVLTRFLRHSPQGLGMLAASEDFEVTRLMGIKANRVISLAFILSGLLAGIASIFIVARVGVVQPTMGFTPVLKAFIATVIGGLGSLSGAVVGGFVLGAIEVGLDATLPTALLPYRDAFALTIVIFILYVRPAGLLARKTELE